MSVDENNEEFNKEEPDLILRKLEEIINDIADENFSCQVCFCPYDNNEKKPLSFMCGHSLCSECYQKLEHKNCHICRREIYLESQPNILILDIIASMNKLIELTKKLMLVTKNPKALFEMEEKIKQEFKLEYEQLSKKLEESEKSYLMAKHLADVKDSLIRELHTCMENLRMNAADENKRIEETYKEKIEKLNKITREILAKRDSSIKSKDDEIYKLEKTIIEIRTTKDKIIERKDEVMGEFRTIILRMKKEKDSLIVDLDKHKNFCNGFHKDLEEKYLKVKSENTHLESFLEARLLLWVQKHKRKAVAYALELEKLEKKENRKIENFWLEKQWRCPICDAKNPWLTSLCQNGDFNKNVGYIIQKEHRCAKFYEEDFYHKKEICGGKLYCEECNPKRTEKDVDLWHKTESCRSYYGYAGSLCPTCHELNIHSEEETTSDLNPVKDFYKTLGIQYMMRENITNKLNESMHHCVQLEKILEARKNEEDERESYIKQLLTKIQEQNSEIIELKREKTNGNSNNHPNNRPGGRFLPKNIEILLEHVD